MIRFEGDDDEWMVIENIKIPAIVPLSFSKTSERLYALPGGIRVTHSWASVNYEKIVQAFKTHRPKVCEYHR